MKLLIATIVLSAAVVPGIAFAQSADTKYCSALSDKYDYYVERSGEKGGGAPPIEVTKAMDNCKSSPASSIPVLEKALKAARLDLPPRG
jgi:hypothetical protein